MNERTPGREPLTFVEIEQDFCQLEFGVAPCTATGLVKCFNTLATCEDPDNFTRGKLTLRFCKPTQQQLPGVYAIPNVLSVSTAPTIINPGGRSQRSGPLGQRAVLTVTFQDGPGSDLHVDKYVHERGYNPLNRGTFWGKWLARNPYYNNRVIRVREGYRGQSLGQMRTRTYLIEKVAGPDSNGQVTITAKDVLKLADNERAQAPRPSPGEITADIDRDASITQFDVTGATASDYPASGTVRINREVLRYTGRSNIANGVRLTGVTRGTDGSERVSHRAGDRVQLCLRYNLRRVDSLAYEWLTQYGDVPPAYIDYSAWQAEAGLWLDQFDLTGLITEPTGVTDLLSEITEQCLFHIWWDEREQLIKLEAIKPPIYEDVPEINDDQHILADSVRMQDEAAQRVSQVWVFWGQRDPTERLDTDDNWRRLRVRADLDAETADQYGDQRIRKIYSRWLHSEGQVINVSTRLLNRFRDTPKTMTLELDAKDRGLWTGSVVDVETRAVTDFTGLPAAQRWQVLSAEEIVPGHRVRYTLEAFEFDRGGAIAGRWMAQNAPNFDNADEMERLTGAWYAREDGKVDDENAGYAYI